MTTLREEDRREIEDLLPWYATRTLTPAEMRRISLALEGDAELRRRLAIVEEELGEAVQVAESLGAPSARAFEKLAAVMEAEPRRASLAERATGGITQWIAGTLTALSPRKLAFAAVAAVCLILLQAAVLTGVVLHERNQPQLASVEDDAARADGAIVLVAFEPTATASDIGGLLQRVKGSIIDGPGTSGIYRVRIAKDASGADRREAVVAELGKASGVVRFAAPAK